MKNGIIQWGNMARPFRDRRLFIFGIGEGGSIVGRERTMCKQDFGQKVNNLIHYKNLNIQH